MCRLNQELFPEPGNPMARTTVPFEARGTTGGVAVFSAPVDSTAARAAGGAFSAAPAFSCETTASGAVAVLGVWSASPAASASSPSPSPARVDVVASTRARRLDGCSFRILFPACRTLRRRLRFNFRFSGFAFDDSRRNHRPRPLAGIVIGRLKRGLCRLALARFRVLFWALETIAHPLAHVWFVTQLHISGNPARRKRTKPASLEVVRRGPALSEIEGQVGAA